MSSLLSLGEPGPALDRWLLHHQRKGPVDSFWMGSIRSFRAFPSSFFSSLPLSTSSFIPKCEKDQWNMMTKPTLFVLVNLSNDFPQCKVKCPRWLPFTARLYGVWQCGAEMRGQVAGFRLPFYSGVSSQALYQRGEWVTAHSAQWILSWCGH